MTTAESDALDHLAVLGDLQDQFLASIDLVDPTTPIPWCGRWRVRNLVVHLARIHHWAAGQAQRRQETPLGRGPFVLTDLYASCALELRSTLADLDPSAPAWTLDDSGTAAFWRRRQTHETLVHLWDLRTAGGLPLDVPPAVWADTVDEVVTVMQPRQERMGRMEPLAAPIKLVADDTDASWLLGGTGEPAAQVTGPALALALLVWGRTTPDDGVLGVTADRRALDEALGRRLTP
ncbi:maleylpyruvate isomerase family mycothiol-dependent enzyme [Cellulomonas rhizosphaerae]|uniref:Maleylpyruvate isomerase family mycothiol-dependent enzyme n=1 Tax=Cellulomonas rhizosphaerae TaxID=2293719 RepID=A0A413RQS4_9CELL|nr:maleylpyruvate isomerase family mycothiol-dependent enzyme [Cellulomonas rhizosphaerae]RHA44271.1 maleylpyruvate isomerase family mycothiol-dependent enzyme [Cellulomonas rhizosphaerae]